MIRIVVEHRHLTEPCDPFGFIEAIPDHIAVITNMSRIAVFIIEKEASDLVCILTYFYFYNNDTLLLS